MPYDNQPIIKKSKWIKSLKENEKIDWALRIDIFKPLIYRLVCEGKENAGVCKEINTLYSGYVPWYCSGNNVAVSSTNSW